MPSIIWAMILQATESLCRSTTAAKCARISLKRSPASHFLSLPHPLLSLAVVCKPRRPRRRRCLPTAPHHRYEIMRSNSRDPPHARTSHYNANRLLIVVSQATPPLPPLSPPPPPHPLSYKTRSNLQCPRNTHTHTRPLTIVVDFLGQLSSRHGCRGRTVCIFYL